jgi:hypothetical protein
LFAFAATLLLPGINAQSNPPASDSNVSACPTATTLDELTKALDEAVSGPGNKDRTCLRALLLPGARLTAVYDGSRWRGFAVLWETEATAGTARVDKP